jgi:hypothetical protein
VLPVADTTPAATTGLRGGTGFVPGGAPPAGVGTGRR